MGAECTHSGITIASSETTRAARGRASQTKASQTGRRRQSSTPTVQAVETRPAPAEGAREPAATEGDLGIGGCKHYSKWPFRIIPCQGSHEQCSTMGTHNGECMGEKDGERGENRTGMPLQSILPISKDKGDEKTLAWKIGNMLGQGVIEEASEGSRCFISHLFLRPKNQTNTEPIKIK